MDFEIILQECFLGDPLPKLLKRFRYVEQNGCQGYKLNKMLLTTFKRLLLLTQCIYFEIILQEGSLGDHLPKLLKPFPSVEQDGRQS